MGIIYRPPNQVDFIDHFNNALGKLPFQSNEIYLRGDFNISLFFEGYYVLKKYFKRLRSGPLKIQKLDGIAIDQMLGQNIFCSRKSFYASH